MRCVVVMTAVVMVAMMVQHSDGCTCPLRHPQQHFCEADFVANVKVHRVVASPDGQTVLRVRVRRIFKGSPKAMRALSGHLIYTIPGTCSLNITTRTMHVITGEIQAGKPWTSACHFAAPWTSLAPKMKKGFRLLYNTSCDCPIMSCHWWENHCPSSSFYCAWRTSSRSEDCHARHSVCLSNPAGGCRWVGGRLLRECVKARRSEQHLVASNAGRGRWRNVASLVPTPKTRVEEEGLDAIISNDVVDVLPAARGREGWSRRPHSHHRYQKPRKPNSPVLYSRNLQPAKPVKPSQLGEILFSQSSSRAEMVAPRTTFNSSRVPNSQRNASLIPRPKLRAGGKVYSNSSQVERNLRLLRYPEYTTQIGSFDHV